MAAVAQAFSQWIGSGMTRDYRAFQDWSRVVLAQSWATVRGTMVRGPDGQSESWLQVYADRPLWGTSWAGLARCCRSFNSLYATSRSWRQPSCSTWGRCDSMTGSCDGSFRQ